MTTLARNKPAPARYEGVVEEQLGRARSRIRLLDTTAAVLGFLIFTLAYGLGMALLDRALAGGSTDGQALAGGLPAVTRQVAFAVYALASMLFLFFALVRPLYRRVNPYYAARQVERILPDAKNSVVNWLDLRTQSLPPAIRQAVSHRAARDLSHADLESAISARRAFWLGGTTAALVVAGFVLFTVGPRQFFSLLGRAFAPFTASSLAPRTQIEVLRPAGGDATVPVGRAVSIAVWVEGRVPDPNRADGLKLLFRHHPADPYEEQALEPGESRREWVTEVADVKVQHGFWYKVAGGDAQTPEFHVQVRSTPLLTDFEATYHYRPYLRVPDNTTHERYLEGLRGTEVTLVARTNRKVKEATLQIDGEPQARPGEPVPEDPNAMRFRFVLDRAAEYRLAFVSEEGERYADPAGYPIKVIHDQPPRVELTKPGADVRLPANGILKLQGLASDDFGVTGLALKMRVEGQEQLRTLPYRKGKSFRLADGRYPQQLDYGDVVELRTVRRKDGSLLRPGTIIRYWLEATDNCDYPMPNVGRTREYKVTIAEPEKDEQKQQMEEKQAKQDQKKQEEKQDKDLDRQNQAAKRPGGAGKPKNDPQQKHDDDVQEKYQQLQQAANQQNKDKNQNSDKNQQDKGGPGQAQSGDDDENKQKKKQGGGGGAGQSSSVERNQEKNGGGGGDSSNNDKPSEKKNNSGPGGSDSAAENKQENSGGNDNASSGRNNPDKKEKGGRPSTKESKGGQPGNEDKEANGSKKEASNPGHEKKPSGESPEKKTGAQENKGTGQENKTAQENQRDKPPTGADPKRKPAGAEKSGKDESDPSKRPGDKNQEGDGNQGEKKPTAREKNEHGGGNSTTSSETKQEGPKGQQSPAVEKKPGPKGAGANKPEGKGPDKGPSEPNKEKPPGDQGSESTGAGKQEPNGSKGQDPSKKSDPNQGGGDKQPSAGNQGTEKSEDAGNKGSQSSGDKGSESDGGKGQDSAGGKKEPKTGQDGNDQSGDKGSGRETSKGQNKQGKVNRPEQKTGNASGGTVGARNGSGETGQRGADDSGAAANAANRKKAGELQLEDLKKKITPDVLKKLGWTRADLEKFLKEGEEYNQRLRAKAAQDDKVPNPAEPGGPLPNLGPRQVAPDSAGKSDKLDYGGAALPPPEFRESYREFTEKLSTLKKDGK